MYFDEAHMLTTDVSKANVLWQGKDLYDCLLSHLNHFVEYPVFSIFLSTNSSLSDLAPPTREAKSSRARNALDHVQAPITETPFDCSPTLYVVPNTLKWQDVCKIEFMAQFGRPM